MYDNLRKDGFSVNIDALEAIEDPSKKAFAKSLLDYFDKTGVPGSFRYEKDDFENMSVIARIELMDGKPETKPRPGYLHYGRYGEMDEEKREAVSLMVKALSDLTLPSGRSALDVYGGMTEGEQMTAESIVCDVFEKFRITR